MRVFLDCDGVLADFDKRAMEILDGVKPRDYEGLEGEDTMWERIYAVDQFFLSLEPMRDMQELVEGVLELGFMPIVLTGVPKPRAYQKSSVTAADQKRAWVKKHLGDYEVITCRSVLKCSSCKIGDVLIDDWTKYKHLWENAGGKFIVHTSAKRSLEDLKEYLRRE